jgi:hypothetical protein
MRLDAVVELGPDSDGFGLGLGDGASALGVLADHAVTATFTGFDKHFVVRHGNAPMARLLMSNFPCVKFFNINLLQITPLSAETQILFITFSFLIIKIIFTTML